MWRVKCDGWNEHNLLYLLTYCTSWLQVFKVATNINMYWDKLQILWTVLKNHLVAFSKCPGIPLKPTRIYVGQWIGACNFLVSPCVHRDMLLQQDQNVASLSSFCCWHWRFCSSLSASGSFRVSFFPFGLVPVMGLACLLGSVGCLCVFVECVGLLAYAGAHVE
jgi:hypothetical protein